MTIINWPKTERPREKLLAHGPKYLTDAELIAIFLRTGVRGKTALDIARDILKEHGSLKKLLTNASAKPIRGVGQAKLAMLKAVVELGRRYLDDDIYSDEVLNNPSLTRQFLANHLKNYPHEVFACLFLNSRNYVICFEELFQGTIDQANVYPREVVKRGLQHNAAKVILAHNHPSGNPYPSSADREITKILVDALGLVGIQVIDHIVIGGKESISFAELGLI